MKRRKCIGSWKKSLGYVNKKNRQNLNKEVLPMLYSGSPDRNIDRTFTSIFYFPQESIKAIEINRTYRNPIYLAKEYKKMIDSGEVKNQAELAKLKRFIKSKNNTNTKSFKIQTVYNSRIRKIW